MKQFALITNSTIDEDAAYYHDHEVGYAPLQYTLDGTTYTEDFWQSLSAKEFYDALREGKMCMTSQTAVETYLKLYREALERGQDVLYLGFSSGLSGSFQAGVIAAQDLAPEFPDRRIVCVDSLSVTGGMHILVDQAIAMRDAGESVDTVAQRIKLARTHITHLVTPNDLKHLYRGGRLSHSSAIVGSIVGIKPVLYVNEEGKVGVLTKVRGRVPALQYVADVMHSEVSDPKQTVWISHGDCLADAELLRDYIAQKHGMHAEIRMLGTVLGAHGGPGTIVLSYAGGSRTR